MKLAKCNKIEVLILSTGLLNVDRDPGEFVCRKAGVNTGIYGRSFGIVASSHIEGMAYICGVIFMRHYAVILFRLDPPSKVTPIARLRITHDL